MSHLTKLKKQTINHPCFFAESKGRYGRIHLPVAADCNIQCAYCRRDHECIHENRPGVTNGVISPEEALDRLERARINMPHITVAGIAGPGDAFCDPSLTLRTFQLIRRRYSDIALCVSSNGLNVKDHIDPLCDLDVRFVTITVNTIYPDIGARFYKMVKFQGKILTGKPAAETLIARQLETIALLKAKNFIVKVNSVVVPGIREAHLLFLAKQMGRLKVDLMNLLPLIPLSGTDMEGLAPPSPDKMRKLREKAGRYVPQMRHCTRCRSDAAGYLHNVSAKEQKKWS